MRGSRRKGILFRTEKGFRRGGAGENWRSIKQGEQKTRKHWCWEEPKLPKGFVSLGIDLHDLL